MAIALTFLFTTALYGVSVWLGARRIIAHLKENPEGVNALTKHLLIPLLGKKEKKPETANVNETLPGS